MSQQVFREVERGNLVAVRKLLASNPNCVNIVNAGENRTPLHVASWHGFDHIVKQLLQRSARYDAQDRFGNTPLHLACDSGSLETVQQLLGPGRKTAVRIKNRDGQTPLHVAVLGGLEDIVKELLVAGAQTDVKDKVGGVVGVAVGLQVIGAVLIGLTHADGAIFHWDSSSWP
eukprot:evm.model.scf_3144.2 EVM.evm.TU.scf_3144.2   scf_3144:12493-14043(+)